MTTPRSWGWAIRCGPDRVKVHWDLSLLLLSHGLCIVYFNLIKLLWNNDFQWTYIHGAKKKLCSQCLRSNLTSAWPEFSKKVGFGERCVRVGVGHGLQRKMKDWRGSQSGRHVISSICECSINRHVWALKSAAVSVCLWFSLFTLCLLSLPFQWPVVAFPFSPHSPCHCSITDKPTKGPYSACWNIRLHVVAVKLDTALLSFCLSPAHY